MGKLFKGLWENTFAAGIVEFIKAWGWPLMSSLASILLGILAWAEKTSYSMLALMVLASFSIGLSLSREWRDRQKQAPSLLPPAPTPPQAETWLTEIAERDLLSEAGVVITHHSAILQALDTPNPYIEFTWEIFNGLVWNIEIEEHPTGHIFLKNRRWIFSETTEFPHTYILKPQYGTLSFPSTTKRTIAHGEKIKVHLQYWLSPSDAGIFHKYTPPKGEHALMFENFHIWTLRGPKEQQHRVALNLVKERNYV
jgi:hypothetical protein